MLESCSAIGFSPRVSFASALFDMADLNEVGNNARELDSKVDKVLTTRESYDIESLWSGLQLGRIVLAA